MLEITDVMGQHVGLIYRGLIKQIESAEGWGFHNKDQGHPIHYSSMEDIPEGERYKATMGMFRTVSALAKFLKENEDEVVGTEGWVDLSDWDKFRAFAMKCYQEKRG